MITGQAGTTSTGPGSGASLRSQLRLRLVPAWNIERYGHDGFPGRDGVHFNIDFIAVEDESKFDHASVTCTLP